MVRFLLAVFDIITADMKRSFSYSFAWLLWILWLSNWFDLLNFLGCWYYCRWFGSVLMLFWNILWDIPRWFGPISVNVILLRGQQISSRLQIKISSIGPINPYFLPIILNLRLKIKIIRPLTSTPTVRILTPHIDTSEYILQLFFDITFHKVYTCHFWSILFYIFDWGVLYCW